MSQSWNHLTKILELIRKRLSVVRANFPEMNGKTVSVNKGDSKGGGRQLAILGVKETLNGFCRVRRKTWLKRTHKHTHTPQSAHLPIYSLMQRCSSRLCNLLFWVEEGKCSRLHWETRDNSLGSRRQTSCWEEGGCSFPSLLQRWRAAQRGGSPLVSISSWHLSVETSETWWADHWNVLDWALWNLWRGYS